MTAPTSATNAPTIGDLAHEVRSKNAGPFWVTMEMFMRDDDGYRTVADESFIDERVIADIYEVEVSTIRIFRIPSLRVVKISFPRPISQGALRDRDMHAGQHHVPLALRRTPSRGQDVGSESAPQER